jgi:hypothetical protein
MGEGSKPELVTVTPLTRDTGNVVYQHFQPVEDSVDQVDQ